MKLVFTGPKCSGKSKLGKSLSELLLVPFYEIDLMVEELFKDKSSKCLTCRAICSQYGEDYFRGIEKEVVEQTLSLNNCIISTGGSTLLNKDSRTILRQNSILILITSSADILLKRLSEKEIPNFLNSKSAQDMFVAKACLVTEVVKPFADVVIDSSDLSFEKTLDIINKDLISFIKSLNKITESKLKLRNTIYSTPHKDENIIKVALES